MADYILRNRKRYYFFGKWKSKADAKNVADALRNNGWGALMRQQTFRGIGKHWYVYYHKPKR